jgi:hypothetical protein
MHRYRRTEVGPASACAFQGECRWRHLSTRGQGPRGLLSRSPVHGISDGDQEVPLVRHARVALVLSVVFLGCDVPDVGSTSEGQSTQADTTGTHVETETSVVETEKLSDTESAVETEAATEAGETQVIDSTVAPAVELRIEDNEVFDGSVPAPTDWTTLDISHIVGKRKAFVVLRVINGGPSSFVNVVAFRPGGDTSDYRLNVTPTGAQAAALGDTGSANTVTTYTNENGELEWAASDAATGLLVDVVVYLAAP